MKIAELTFTPSYSGIAVFVWDIYQNIDNQKYHVDIISPNNPLFDAKRKELEENNSKWHKLNITSKLKFKKYLDIFFKLRKIQKIEKYNIVHLHSGSNIFNIIAVCALRGKNLKIITHAHNEENIYKPLNKLAKKIVSKYSDIQLSCSEKAAKAIFDNSNYKIINNGIDTKAFTFSEKNRHSIRKEFNVDDDEIFIGTVGRLEAQKNQTYLLDIFENIVNNNTKAKLLIVGDGSLKVDLDKKIKNQHLDGVIIEKSREDIPKILSGLDYFVLPSLYEGLPISAIEAQANGLPTIISDKTSKMTIITDQCIRLGISKADIKNWTNILTRKPNTNRSNYSKLVSEAGFDTKSTIKQIENAYESTNQK